MVSQSPTYLIPKSFDDAVSRIESFFGFKNEANSCKSEHEFAVKHHITTGRHIRYRWALFKPDESPLAYSMRDMGFTHGDDMSSAILRAAWCKYHGQDFDLDGYLKKCNEHWERLKEERQ